MSRTHPLIELRRYRPEEAAAPPAVFRAAVRRTALADYRQLQVGKWAPDLIDATAWVERRAAVSTWVAVVEGEFFGFIDLDADGDIHMLYVHPDHGGHGVGSNLLEEIERHAIDQHLAQLTAQASTTALGVLPRRGFRSFDPSPSRFAGSPFSTSSWPSA